MHLNQIKSFLAVSKTLNFTNAARQNGVPQSTISRHINDLEQQLGVRLFYRTKRDVQLTEEGRTFIPYAQEILDAARKGSYAVKQLHDGAKGRLSIATVNTSGTFLRECLKDFGQTYRDVVVDITYVSGGEVLIDENDAPYDFHFLYSDMLPDNDEFDMMEISTDNLAFVLPRGLSEDVGRDIPSLARQRFILLSEEENPILYMEIMNFCRSHRFSPSIVNQTNDIRSVLLSVSAGLGISILPTVLPGDMLSEGFETVPIDESFSISCALAWKKSLLNPAASLFLDVVRRRLEMQSQR